MYIHESKARVRYAETDQMGYIYYGNYAIYYEIGRTESLRSLGISYKSLEDMGIMLPVSENYTKYIRPGRYDDLLTIKTMIKEKPNIKLKFDYEIYNQEETLINTGHTTLVFVSEETRRPIKCPDHVMTLLESYFT